jgi:hypothetical protein
MIKMRSRSPHLEAKMLPVLLQVPVVAIVLVLVQGLYVFYSTISFSHRMKYVCVPFGVQVRIVQHTSVAACTSRPSPKSTDSSITGVLTVPVLES